MPLQRCEIDGGPGWKWGDAGACYGYTAGDEESEAAARDKAMKQAAAMGEFPGTGENRDDRPNAPVEHRTAHVGGVDYAQRIIEVVAVPYDQTALIEYRGEMWNESFARGAFDGIEKRPNRVRANRDHDKSRTIGKVRRFFPSRDEGLVAEVRIAPTPLGDETLALADPREDALSASVTFAVRNSDQQLRRPDRRIFRAFVDHLAFLPDPAYTGATVLDVRSAPSPPAPTGRLVTPELDGFIADDVLQWAYDRFQR